MLYRYGERVMGDGYKYEDYYSENINATNNVDNRGNGWSTEKTEETKMYLIVINEEVKNQMMKYKKNQKEEE